MNDRGTLWIIPDEKQIIQPLFEKKIGEGISHTSKMKEFVDTYHIDLNFRDNDYHETLCMIAGSGHLVIKSDDDVSQLIFYIPELVTDRQIEFLIENQMEFSKYQVVGGYSMIYLGEDGVAWKTLHGISEILTEMNKKNRVENKNRGGR